jgi:tRNA 2-selenouridine synthase
MLVSSLLHLDTFVCSFPMSSPANVSKVSYGTQFLPVGCFFLPPLILLAGRTGSGKTQMLQSLAARGQQVVDLELLARHRGSAFGGLAQPAQPSQPAFNQQLISLFGMFNPTRPVFLEQKGSCIGRLRLPDWLRTPLPNATVIYLDVPLEVRIERILLMYGEVTNEQFAATLAKLAGRLPAATRQAASEALARNDRYTFIRLLVSYYDTTRRYASPTPPGHKIFVPTLDQTAAVDQVLKVAGALTSV